MSIRLDSLAQRLGASLVGEGSVSIQSCAPIELAGPDQITFLANARYLRHLSTTRAAAVIIDSKTPAPEHVRRLVCDDPYFAFRNAMLLLHGPRVHPQVMRESAGGLSGSAMVHPDARVGEGCAIHPFAVVESGALIGRDCTLYPGSYVGRNAVLGDDCILYPNAVVYDHCRLGHRVTLHANTVVGQDGFGYATHGGQHHKIPQAGIVVIEDDVELGAGCAIERGAIGETRIGQGTKFADLISIGHGTRVGRHCLFVSLVGVAGSVEVGDYVALGGQVGVAGHLRIGHMVQAAGKTAIVADVPDNSKIGGIPAVDLDTAKRNALASMSLYELAQRVKKLEREIRGQKSEVGHDSGE